jgi:hypothetical protein
MAILNQLQLPDELLAAIARRAKEQGISIEEQVVRDLTRAECTSAEDEQTLLAEIRREREAMAARGVHLTEDFLKKAKNWGRD